MVQTRSRNSAAVVEPVVETVQETDEDFRRSLDILKAQTGKEFKIERYQQGENTTKYTLAVMRQHTAGIGWHEIDGMSASGKGRFLSKLKLLQVGIGIGTGELDL